MRTLAAEFLVTLCEAREKAPGMMRKLPQVGGWMLVGGWVGQVVLADASFSASTCNRPPSLRRDLRGPPHPSRPTGLAAPIAAGA